MAMGVWSLQLSGDYQLQVMPSHLKLASCALWMVDQLLAVRIPEMHNKASILL